MSTSARIAHAFHAFNYTAHRCRRARSTPFRSLPHAGTVMSYSRGVSVRIQESASLLPRNLAVLQGLKEGGLAYGVIGRRRATVTRVSTATTETETVSLLESESDISSRPLTNLAWCRLKSSREVLVITSYRGFKITTWDGLEVIYENPFESRKGPYDLRFAKGVTSVEDVVCVGTSEGDIFVLYVPDKGSKVIFSRLLQGHSSPITDMCSCNYNQVASSDESGMIIVWSNPVISAESRLVINEPGAFPCLCLCHWQSLLVAGYSNGLVRMFSAETGFKRVEIAAHGRTITALDIAQDSGLLLSVSEDCTACIWGLSSDDNPVVSHLVRVHIPDSLLCGGCFCDPRGDSFALTAFESETILTFTKSQS